MFVQSKALEIVEMEVRSKGTLVQQTNTGLKICCPIHDERSPSCNINLTAPGVPVGWVHCWGCGYSEHWNTFAKAIGWQRMSSGDTKEMARIAPNAMVRMSTLRHELLGDTASEPDWEVVEPWLKGRMRLDFDQDWRNIPNKLLKDMGCQRVIAKDGTPFVIIPVRRDGVLLGLVRGRYAKSDKKNERSYINSPGRWVKTQGLLGLDEALATAMYQEHGFIILVEGPRDALKLLAQGYPAVAVLGSDNWSLSKLGLLIDAGVTTITSLADNDAVGRKMARRIAKDCAARHYPHVRVKLPPVEKIGRELDPAVLTPKQLIKVKQYILANM